MQDFRNLDCWKRSMPFAAVIEQMVARFPPLRVKLARQMIEAADSIPSNISEGCGRSGRKELLNFLSISVGSCSELETHLERACVAGLISLAQHEPAIQEVKAIRMMICGLMRAIRRKMHEEEGP